MRGPKDAPVGARRLRPMKSALGAQYAQSRSPRRQKSPPAEVPAGRGPRRQRSSAAEVLASTVPEKAGREEGRALTRSRRPGPVAADPVAADPFSGNPVAKGSAAKGSVAKGSVAKGSVAQRGVTPERAGLGCNAPGDACPFRAWRRGPSSTGAPEGAAARPGRSSGRARPVRTTSRRQSRRRLCLSEERGRPRAPRPPESGSTRRGASARRARARRAAPRAAAHGASSPQGPAHRRSGPSRHHPSSR